MSEGISNPPGSKDSAQSSEEKAEVFYQTEEVFVSTRMKNFDTKAFLTMPLPGIGSSSNPDSFSWQIFAMPDVEASEKLKASCDLKKLDRAARMALKYSEEEIACLDDPNSSTFLTRILSDPDTAGDHIEHIIPLTAKLYECGWLGKQEVNNGNDALFYACVNLPLKPFVAGYLAAMFLEANINIKDRRYASGDTLIHVLTRLGDSHAGVIEELVTVSRELDQPILDVDMENYEGETPIEIAVKGHRLLITDGRRSTLKVTQILVNLGVRVNIMKNGIHLLSEAILLHADPNIIQLLLTRDGCCAVNSRCSLLGETPLHKIARRTGSVSVSEQIAVWKLLIKAGADQTVVNVDSMRPMDLIPQDYHKYFV